MSRFTFLFVIFLISIYSTSSSRTPTILISVIVDCHPDTQEYDRLFCNESVDSLKNLNQTEISNFLKTNKNRLVLGIISWNDIPTIPIFTKNDNVNETKYIHLFGRISNDGHITYYTLYNYEKITEHLYKPGDGHELNYYENNKVFKNDFQIISDNGRQIFVSKDTKRTDPQSFSPMNIRRKYIKDRVHSKIYGSSKDTSINNDNINILSEVSIQSSTDIPSINGFSVGIWVFIGITMSVASITISVLFCQKFCNTCILPFRMLPSIAGHEAEKEYKRIVNES